MYWEVCDGYGGKREKMVGKRERGGRICIVNWLFINKGRKVKFGNLFFIYFV